MKTINLRGTSDNKMSENEMKIVKGGMNGSDGIMCYRKVQPDDDDGSGGAGADAGPCPPPHRGCPGPHGAWINGELCCLLPCNGILHTYGYAFLTGFSRCPW